MTPNLLAVPVMLCGTEAQRETYLPPCCQEVPPKVTAALIETSTLLDTLLRNTTDFIYFKDLQSRFVAVNVAILVVSVRDRARERW